MLIINKLRTGWDLVGHGDAAYKLLLLRGVQGYFRTLTSGRSGPNGQCGRHLGHQDQHPTRSQLAAQPQVVPQVSNDLVEAVGRADDEALRSLRRIVQFVYCNVPSPCWGTPDRVKAWLGGEHTNWTSA